MLDLVHFQWSDFTIENYVDVALFLATLKHEGTLKTSSESEATSMIVKTTKHDS